MQINGPHIVSCVTNVERQRNFERILPDDENAQHIALPSGAGLLTHLQQYGEWCDAAIICWDCIKQTDIGLCSQVRLLAPHCVTIVLCLSSEMATIENCGLCDIDDIIALDPQWSAVLKRTLNLASERRYWRSRQATVPGEAHALAHHASNGAVITCPEGLIRWVNDGFINITGYQLDEVIGRTPGDVLQGPDTDYTTVQGIRDSLKKGDGITAELLNYRKNGESFWMHIEIQPMRDNDGAITGFLAVEYDCTEHRLAQRQLATKGSALEAIVNSVPGAVFQLKLPRDGSLWFNHISKGAAQLLGHPSNMLIDKPLHNLGSHIHPEDAFPLRASLDQARISKRMWQEHFRVIVPGRGICHVAGQATAIVLDGVVHLNGMLYCTDEINRPRSFIKLKQENSAVTAK